MTAENLDAQATQEIEIQNSIRDGSLVKFFSDISNDGLTITLVFEKEEQAVELELRGVTGFDFKYNHEVAHFPLAIAFVKCLLTIEGGLYLSLSPWKENERFESENDEDVFRSKSFGLRITT